MFSKIIIFGLLAVVLSAAVEEPVPIVSQEADANPDGSFKWNYKSGDGSSQEQSGELQGTGEEVGEAVSGSASWSDPDGNKHELTYVADANGYQPQGADLPQAPEIPAEILKSIEYNAQHPEENVEE